MITTNDREKAAQHVSLVIPAKNAAGVLRQCLEAVVPLLGKELGEILLVDDGSTDDTAAIAASYGVKVLTGPRRGPGAARNIGWRSARHDLVWFIDSDCVAEPQALARLLNRLDSMAVAGVGGSYGNMRPDSVLACLIHEEIVERHRAMNGEVDYLASFNVLYRRKALEEVGGFAEAVFDGPGAPGAEDIEMSFRLRDAGYQLGFVCDSRVGHFHPTRLLRYLRSQRLHGFFRVRLYLNHRGRTKGDAYSGLVDHLQPPLAMLLLASVPLAFWPPGYVAPLALLALLLLLQAPMTVRLVRRMREAKYCLFAPLGLVRSFWRGFGMSFGTLSHVLRIGPSARPLAPSAKSPEANSSSKPPHPL